MISGVLQCRKSRTSIGAIFFGFSGGVGAAALTSGVWSELAAAQSTSPNEKLNIACVGTANRAAADVDGIKGENIVALCDVDKNYLDRAASQFPSARTYADYREMLDKEAAKLDAVVVATADHNHAPAAIRAIRAGLHVYCEKPLTHTVQEARLIAEAAKKHKVATQMGTQIHAEDNYRRVVEIIQSGAIGDVSEVHVWVGKAWGGGERPAGSQQPPDALSWDLWLGPAPSGRSGRASTIPAIGAAGGTSAPARSATWPATTWTCRSGR